MTIAIAVMYGLVVLIAAPALTRRGVLRTAGACAALTVVAYLITHGGEAPGMALLRCGVSLAALGLTTLLVHRMKAALDAVARSERRYRAIFESTEAALWEEDYTGVAAALAEAGCRSARDVEQLAAREPDTVLRMMRRIRTLDVNETAVRLVGARDKAQLRADLGAIFGPEALPLVTGLLGAILARRPSFQGEAELRRFDGARRIVLVNARFGLDGEAGRVVVSAVDVTERARTEEALSQARTELAHVSRVSMLGELAASLAHEVNQPLAAVVTNGEACLRWLARPQPDLDEARTCVANAVRAGRRAADVVQRLRAMIRNGETESVVLDINQVARESVALLEPEMKGQGVALALDLAPGRLAVMGDRIQLQQVLVNLLLNALQAMHATAPKAVRVESRGEAGGGLICVRDCGPGLDETAMARLFTPFFTTKRTGLGVGLSICRSLVSAHGGRIWADSTPGEGAAFFVWLPGEGADPA
ncbi:sensor histidine kinase [Methylobacterium sp. ID0610]|uniref:sensor histidine kinase n=1 Tax=Methylobacterium carpenticola TaxID=3344827 RepID=UPI0036BA640F